MSDKINRRDFTKVIGASLGASGIGAFAPVYANAQQNVEVTMDKNILQSSIGAFSTKTSQLVNDTDHSVMPIHLGVVAEGNYRRGKSDPTVKTIESAMMSLEGGKDAIATSSGMAAITQTLLSLLSSGDTILYHQNLYAAVLSFIEQDLIRYGIKPVKVDMRDINKVENLIAQHNPKVVYFEAYTNPYLEVVDVKVISDLTKDTQSIVVLDNTFLTPMLMKPLELGVDLVIHSMTKYISGHGDALGGIVVGSKELVEKVRQMRLRVGGVLAPEQAYLMLRGLRTLAFRMPVHCENTIKLAEWLNQRPEVLHVNCPALKENVGHEVAKKQAPAYGGLLSFVLKGGTEAGQSLMQNLKMCKTRTSLGEPNTLVIAGKGLESFFNTEAGFVRVAVGLEGIDDIIADFDQAMS